MANIQNCRLNTEEIQLAPERETIKSMARHEREEVLWRRRLGAAERQWLF
jgi:hypothetical protein